MNFKDFKEKVESEKLEQLPFKYVPIMHQMTMIGEIKSICLKDDDFGLKRIDYLIKNVFELVFILVNYTDLEFPDLYHEENEIDLAVALEIYDFFKEKRLIELVLKQSHVKEFVSLLHKEIKQEIAISNNPSYVISQMLNGIASKLPNQNSIQALMTEIPTLFNSMTNVPAKPTSNKRNSKKTTSKI